jgi:phenylalanyl-tRNA synthetase beta chain
MKVPVSWLNEYIDISDLSVEELVKKITFCGIEVEGVETVGAMFSEHFVVGEILAAEKHPNADKLQVCTVFDGADKLQIVCGAPNAAAGLKVPLAKIGATVPNGGFKIMAAKIRGVESFVQRPRGPARARPHARGGHAAPRHHAAARNGL